MPSCVVDHIYTTVLKSLFATSLWETEIDPLPWLSLSLPLLPAEALLHTVSARPWCTDDLLHLQPQWHELVQEIIIQAEHLADLEGIQRDSLYVSSMWINAQLQQQNHHSHTHPNSLYSGVIYLQVPENSQRLVFTDPRPQAQVLRPRGAVTNWGFQPRAGLWFMWPSWLQHHTASTTLKQLTLPRISISYNIMLRDNIDTHSARLDLL